MLNQWAQKNRQPRSYCSFLSFLCTSETLSKPKRRTLGDFFKLVLDAAFSPKPLVRPVTLRYFSGGLPNRIPRAFALRRPAQRVHLIKLRSSSATLPSTVNTIFPVGVLVSMLSETKHIRFPVCGKSLMLVSR